MNDYLIYEVAKQRYSDVIDEVSHARTMRSRRYRSRWTGVTRNAGQRFALVAQVLTNRTRTPKHERGLRGCPAAAD